MLRSTTGPCPSPRRSAPHPRMWCHIAAWTENCDGKSGGAAVANKKFPSQISHFGNNSWERRTTGSRFRAAGRVYPTPQQRAGPRRYETSRPQAAISQFNGNVARQITVFSFEAAAPHRQACRRSSTGPYKFRQCPFCQTQRRPVQRQRPDTQRGRLQPRGGGGLLSGLAGGIGGRRGCATAVLSGATKVARHAFSSALRLRIHPTSGQLE